MDKGGRATQEQLPRGESQEETNESPPQCFSEVRIIAIQKHHKALLLLNKEEQGFFNGFSLFAKFASQTEAELST